MCDLTSIGVMLELTLIDVIIRGMTMKCLKCSSTLESHDTHYGLHIDCFTSWFKISSKADFISLTRRSSRSSVNAASSSPQNTSFFL